MSSYCSAVQVELFSDLNKDPTYGCSWIILPVSSDRSPRRLVHTEYFVVLHINTKQYSDPSGRNNGTLNLKLVATEASSDKLISEEGLTIMKSGLSVSSGPGYPFTKGRIYRTTGIVLSFEKKYRSIEVR